MTSPSQDRLFGTNSSMAIKVPCRVATTADITLEGEQTIDGVAVVSGDRVLVKDQSDGTENGIYIADTSEWQRAPDFDGTRDVTAGTLVKVNNGTAGQGFWYVTTTGTIVVGTTSIVFGQASSVLAVISAFMQTMLDDATALDARTTLGAAVGAAVAHNTVAAHATTTDPWGALVVTLSGSAVTFTDMADADYVGQQVMLIMNAAHVFTDGAVFDVQGGQNYTAAAGDMVLLTATAVDAFDVTIFKASGATAAKLPTQTILTSGSGTYTTPTGCTSIVVEGWGGGASGGGGDGTNRGTGGGGGGYFKKRYNNPAASYSYSVGAAAAAVGQGSGGTAGNNTTFDTCTANGGSAGLVSNGGAQGGVTGGTATGGDENIQGGGSTTCEAAGTGAGSVSYGGDSPRGGLGGKVNISTAGQIPGGGSSANNSTGTGADGARGQIVITEYYT